MPHIQAYQLDERSYLVSHQTETSRKNIHITKPLTSDESEPVAAESFALDPEVYAELMDRLDDMLRKDG